MSNVASLVIVAIPEEQDPVWIVSSEPVPHLTLLQLGKVDDVSNIDKILEFVEHAANTSLRRFSLDVDRRGLLGDKNADVVFFKGWDLPDLKQFRAHLLQEPNISKAYLASDQFPEWQPHLTLGYPDKPAAKMKDRWDRISWVQFDRIALWMGDFEGPEFQLQDQYDMAVSMSDLDEVLTHYGVKGMKWGKRNTAPSPVVVTPTASGKVKVTGGKNQPPHSDAVDAKIAIRKAKKSGLDSLSNQELQRLSTRLNLEKQVSTLGKDKLTNAGAQVMKALLEDASKK